MFKEFEKKNGGVDSFVIKEWWSNCNILSFYVSHGSTAYSLIQYSLIPTVKQFSKSVNTG